MVFTNFIYAKYNNYYYYFELYNIKKLTNLFLYKFLKRKNKYVFCKIILY